MEASPPFTPSPFDEGDEQAAPRTEDGLGVLILAPTSNDASLTARFLEKAGFTAKICPSVDDLCDQSRAGCGAMLLAEEALVNGAGNKLIEILEEQPSWSDLPLMLITASGVTPQTRARQITALGEMGNVSMIERPVRPETLVSSCEVALRSRRRQYQVRDLLSKLEGMMLQIQQQARVFDTTLSSISDFTYIFDRSLRFIYANRATLELLGLELKDVVGKTFSELPYPRGLAVRLERQIEHVFQTGEILRDETAYTNPAGRTGYYEYIFTPVLGNDGEVEVVAASTRDTSERRRNEEALREADRRKDEFLAMLAHELRNPLAAVTNAAALLESPNLEDRSWAADVITRQNGQLTHLIDDLLDVSRITVGKIRLREEVLDVALVLDRACEGAHLLIHERGHQLIKKYETGKLWIKADPTRMEQIALNLLTNAAKYTPSGGRIELMASKVEGEVRVVVKDNGVGIASHLLPEMFKLFAQGERSIARSEGGLGIGLTIVQRLVEMHGGRIEALSEGLNQGSSFVIHLPMVAAPFVQQTERPVNGQTSTRRVLIVDDNVDTANSMARLLKRVGHGVEVAYDGPQALEKARQHLPEIVLLDIGLPGMDGFEVARRMRLEPSCEKCVIIAVTGYGQPKDRRRAINAGCHHHLVKPVNIDELKRLIRGEPMPSLVE
ncbi:response regulator [Phragmitibacter flavus]|uniref:histidine kinase n=1 Tax=Phragmitibacter flavus TaxID=2576071 RepID=A0A5R8KCP1_9BACT|nr:PAS domain-containing sensor histidine kinase [Phragmitibacter flavus]TLD69705.1 response regulator [Phragmitibacter flavus]